MDFQYEKVIQDRNKHEVLYHYHLFKERFKQITFGIEINLSKVIDVRLGYDNQKRKDYKLSSTAGLAGFHLGFGVKIKKYRVDYAFSSMGQIGSLHRFGISTSF